MKCMLRLSIFWLLKNIESFCTLLNEVLLLVLRRFYFLVLCICFFEFPSVSILHGLWYRSNIGGPQSIIVTYSSHYLIEVLVH